MSSTRWLFLLALFPCLISICSSLTFFWNETYYLNSSFSVNGQERLYHIAYWGTDSLGEDSDYEYPVLLAFHGGGGNATAFARGSQIHLQAIPRGMYMKLKLA